MQDIENMIRNVTADSHEKTPGEPTANRQIKDSVFLNLFKDKKYLLKLYQTLHPEDTTTTEQDLEIVTIENIITDNIYNDLGVRVGQDKLMILVEAQVTWTVNILFRILLYMAHSYMQYFIKTNQSYYKEPKVHAPKPELFVVYTGARKDKPDILTLSDEFFDGEDVGIDVKVKVIYENGTNDIINQYILFCRVFDEQRKEYGLTKKAVEETIRICKDRDILKEYLESREKEVVSIMTSLFDQEEIVKMYVRSCNKENDIETAKRMIKGGKLSLDEIPSYFPNLTQYDIQSLESDMLTHA